jgi:general secretion pathway protein I
MRRARPRGFTLVEVLAAVAVLAIAMAAIIGGMARYASSADHLRQRTLALWVAQNRIAELMSQPTWPSTGRSNGDVEMAGLDWRWTVLVQETPDDRLRRIDVSVSRDGDDGTLASLSAFLRDPAGSP